MEGKGKLGHSHKDLGRCRIGDTGVWRGPASFLAQNRVESFDVHPRVRNRLFARRGICGAPYLLSIGLISGLVEADIVGTWRALQARLNAVSRSVGEVALEDLLDSAREPPIRRDHYILLVEIIEK